MQTHGSLPPSLRSPQICRCLLLWECSSGCFCASKSEGSNSDNDGSASRSYATQAGGRLSARSRRRSEDRSALVRRCGASVTSLQRSLRSRAASFSQTYHGHRPCGGAGGSPRRNVGRRLALPRRDLFSARTCLNPESRATGTWATPASS